MPIQVRRVVVANDSSGKSTATSDETLTAKAVGAGLDISGCELWVTDQMPVDNTESTTAEQEKGSLERFHNLYVRNGQGTAFRVTAIAPDAPTEFHRTETVDYDIVIQGELDLHLDGNQTLRLKAGDTVIVRGALHAWSNPGTEPALIAFVMVDADPVVVNRQTLGQHYPSDANPS